MLLRELRYEARLVGNNADELLLALLDVADAVAEQLDELRGRFDLGVDRCHELIVVLLRLLVAPLQRNLVVAQAL